VRGGWGGRAGLIPWAGGRQPLPYAGTQLLGDREAARARQASAKAVLVQLREGSAAWRADPTACPKQAGGEGEADSRQEGSTTVLNPGGRADLPGVSKALRCGKMTLLLL